MNLRSAAGRKLALPALDAGRLRELVDAAGVSVADRRSRESLIQGLADGRKLDLAQLMHLLSRDELKAMCRALGVTDEGREKALIIARLVGSDDAEPEAPDEPSRSSLPWRSQVVSLLKRDELQDLVERLDIEVGDKRVHQQLVDAVAGSDLPIDELLEDLSRARLKELCRVLGLDDAGKEKAAIIARLAQQAPTGTDEEDDPEDEAEPPAHAASNDPGILLELLGPALRVESAKGWWPAEGTLTVAGHAIPVDIHARSVGATGRNPVERRFQNPANRRPIVARPGRPCLLLGVWTEQGRDRAVIVAFDAYRRLDRTTRFSLFMTQALLEEAADTGFVSHVSGTGEMIFAFRPEALARYLDELAARKTWGALNPGPWALGATAARATTSRPLAPTSASDSVEIRPKAGMFAAFARLNYKPWFALAELVDNAVQSFLSNRQRLIEAGAEGPLVVDINIDTDEITVTDRAAGIRLQDFPRAFSPATPPDDASGLSEFGLGMKAAASWFAREWSVRTSPLGEKVERTVSFDVPRITAEGLNNLPIVARETRNDDHFTVVTMRNLRVKPRGSTLAKIKDHLASIYRILIAEGTLRLRLTWPGNSEDLRYEQPRLLVAPFYSQPDGPPIEWRKEIAVELGAGRRVTGWAGIMETGKHARAGFSVFRRGRLIEGSIGEAYRPRAVFGAHNSFTSLRLVGELYVHGFDVTHTKDGIQWGDDEEDVAYAIRMQLETEEMPLLEQAEGYRTRKTASMLPPDFGKKALDATARAIQIANVEPEAEDALPPADEPPASELKSSLHTFQQQILHLKVQDDKTWEVRIELVRDPGAEWLDSRVVKQDGGDTLQIRINLDHDFSIQHLNDNERYFEPVVRLAVAIGIAEWQAGMQGVKSSGAVRKNANALLRRALADTPIRVEQGDKT